MAQRASYRESLFTSPTKAPDVLALVPEPDPVKPVAAAQAAVKAADAELAGEIFDAAFLSSDALDDYLSYAASDGYDARYAPFGKAQDWSTGSEPYPLALCEFLAYKSVLAYEDGKTIDAHLTACSWRGIEQASYQFFDSTPEGGDAQGFGFVSGDTAFIVMRGSTSFADWRANLDLKRTTGEGLAPESIVKIGGARPERHFGFALAWAHAAPQIENWLKTKAANAKRVCFSGHSQGGALAILGAHDLARRGIARDITVVTFAAPKVGGAEFLADYQRLGLHGRTLRCESPEDAVTYLSAFGDFSAPGAAWRVDKRPMIAGMEKFWAALLFIAGWTEGQPKENSKAHEPDAKSPQTDQNAKTSGSSSTGGEASKKTDAPDAKSNAKSSDNATNIDGRTALAYFAVAVAMFLAFLIARRLIIRYRAHGAAKRYALYFSTLSYGKIREARIRDGTAATDADFARASADLNTHLRCIRGADDGVAAYAPLKSRPIRVLTKSAYYKFVKDTKALKDDSGPKGAYAGYIW